MLLLSFKYASKTVYRSYIGKASKEYWFSSNLWIDKQFGVQSVCEVYMSDAPYENA